MAKNEVGEFELVLGNKQLLSVFFIVVILLGVFFTMGYIVGRNSGGPAGLEAAIRGGGAAAKPLVVDSPGAPPPTQVATANEPTPPEPKKEEPPPVVVEKPKPVEAPKVEDHKAEEEKKAAAEKKKKKEAAAAAEPAAAVLTGALSGTYLQLAAVPKSESDLLISVLRKKGFSATAGAGPKDSNLFRVLVGPLAGADAVSSTRASLNDAGMPGSNAIV